MEMEMEMEMETWRRGDVETAVLGIGLEVETTEGYWWSRSQLSEPASIVGDGVLLETAWLFETGWLLEPSLVFRDDLICKKKDKCTGLLNLNQEHVITLKITISG